MDEADTLEVVIRPYDLLDQAFLYTTYRNGRFYGSCTTYSKKRPAETFKVLTRELAKILDHAQIRIACLATSPSTIIGYCIFTDKHLDWIYVKEDYRRQGVGRILVPKDIESVTGFVTKIGNAILKKKQKENDYGPTEEAPRRSEPLS